MALASSRSGQLALNGGHLLSHHSVASLSLTEQRLHQGKAFCSESSYLSHQHKLARQRPPLDSKTIQIHAASKIPTRVIEPVPSGAVNA